MRGVRGEEEMKKEEREKTHFSSTTAVVALREERIKRRVFLALSFVAFGFTSLHTRGRLSLVSPSASRAKPNLLIPPRRTRESRLRRRLFPFDLHLDDAQKKKEI